MLPDYASPMDEASQRARDGTHSEDPLSATRAASAQWRRRRHRQVSKVNNVPGVFARERQRRRLRLMSTLMR